MPPKQPAQYDLRGAAASESLRPLSAQEVEQVAGAANYVDPLPPTPISPPADIGPVGTSPRFVEV